MEFGDYCVVFGIKTGVGDVVRDPPPSDSGATSE